MLNSFSFSEVNPLSSSSILVSSFEFVHKWTYYFVCWSRFSEFSSKLVSEIITFFASYPSHHNKNTLFSIFMVEGSKFFEMNWNWSSPDKKSRSCHRPGHRLSVWQPRNSLRGVVLTRELVQSCVTMWRDLSIINTIQCWIFVPVFDFTKIRS